MTDNISAGSDFHQEQFDDYYPEIKIIELQCVNLHNNDCTFESCVAKLHILDKLMCWSPTMTTSQKD